MAKILYSEDINFKKLREKSVEMFLEVTETLNKHNITYWLDFGTLLGAVREKKIIEWDGDIDLSTLDIDVDIKYKAWEELKKLGYNIKIEDNNIKIKKNNWRAGFFTVDLHRLRINSRGNAEYLYGKKKNNLQSKILLLKNEINNSIIPKNLTEINFTQFDRVIKLLLNNHFKIASIYSLDKVKYHKCMPNNQHDFQLIIGNRTLKSISNFSNNKKIKLLRIFLKIFNDCSKKFFIKILTFFTSSKNSQPLLRVEHEMKFLNNLGKIIFYDHEFQIPNNHDEYLKKIYGSDWRKPKTKWELSIDSPKKH